jgi:hypothetical protein
MAKIVFAIKAFLIYLETVQIIQLVREQINILMGLHAFVILAIVIIQGIVHTDVDKIKFLHLMDVNAVVDIIIFLEIVRHVHKALISMDYHVFATTDYI